MLPFQKITLSLFTFLLLPAIFLSLAPERAEAEAASTDDDFIYVEVAYDLLDLIDSGELEEDEIEWLREYVPGLNSGAVTGIGANCSGGSDTKVCDSYFIPYSGGTSDYLLLDLYLQPYDANDPDEFIQDPSNPDGILSLIGPDPNNPDQFRAFDATNDNDEALVGTITVSGSTDEPPITEDTESFKNMGTGTDAFEDDEDGEGEESGPQCEAEGLIGLFSCDIMMWVLEKIKDLQQWIVDLLFETDPLVVDGTDNPIYKIWSNIRNVANALLVVAFMAIIFSLALSVNVDAYTIKRLMPKLLVAVVAVQASYLISGLMVDATNILGQGLQGLTDITLDNLDIDGEWKTEGRLGATAASGVLILGAVSGTLLSLGVLAPIFLLLFLVMLGAFIIVALRDVFIILFVVLSPLFFLANLLPATEKWFKFWWSNFARLLLMYPFMILMIQIANLAALITLADAGTPEDFNTGVADEVADRAQNFIKPFMAILMQFMGILSIYFAFRVGGSALSVATQGISKLRGGGGKGKGGGGGGKKGLTGKIKSGWKQRQNEYATGARGNKFTRAITSPKGSYARSRAPGGRETAAQNLATFNTNVGESARTLEAEEHDIKAQQEFGKVGGSQRALKNKVDELRGDGKETLANNLEAMAHHAGNRSMQVAAAKQAASKGAVSEDTFAGLKGSFDKDSVLGQQAMGKVARSAKDGGRQDLFAQYNTEGKSVDEVVQGMSAKDFVEMDSDSIWDRKNNKPTQFGERVKQHAQQQGSSTRRTLGSALSPANGMSGKNREAIKRTLMNDQDKQDWQDTSQPAPSRLHDTILNETSRYEPQSGGGQGGSSQGGSSGSGGGQPGGGGGPQGGPSGGGGGPQGGSPGGSSGSTSGGGRPSPSGGSSSGGASFGGSPSGGGPSDSSGGSGSSQGNPSSGGNRGGGNP